MSPTTLGEGKDLWTACAEEGPCGSVRFGSRCPAGDRRFVNFL